MLNEYERSAVLTSFPWQRGSSVTDWNLGNIQPMGVEVTDLPSRSYAVTSEAQELRARNIKALESLQKAKPAAEPEEVPEALDLRPLSRIRVLAKIRRRGPARFYLVNGEAELEVED